MPHGLFVLFDGISNGDAKVKLNLTKALIGSFLFD